MREKGAVERIAQIIYLGAPFISLLVVTGVVTDPVNSTKLTALIALAFPVLLLLVTKLRKSLFSSNRPLFIV